MWIVAWTLNYGNNNLKDYWLVMEDEDVAKAQYAQLLTNDYLHCACYAPISAGTEPHWVQP